MRLKIETPPASVFFAVGVFLNCIVLTSACASKVTDRTYKSPDGVFAVRLVGTFDRVYSPLARARVKVIIEKNAERFAELGDIYSADWFDIPFDQFYRRLSWTESRVFLMTGMHRGVRPDSIAVKNESGTQIKAIAIATADTVVVVDIPPDSTAVVPVGSMSGGSSVFVRVTAELANGRRLQESINLTPAMTARERNAIAITVRDRVYIGLSIKDVAKSTVSGCCGRRAESFGSSRVAHTRSSDRRWPSP
jgi:hypothetical protein